VIAAQLVGNAAGRILPGGGATATAASARLLRSAGMDTAEAAAGFSATTAIRLATTFALPVVALPAILGGARVDHSLAMAAYIGLRVEAARNQDTVVKELRQLIEQRTRV
jgi:hypothetical protein